MFSRIWQIFYSTLAAFFGVQSNQHRQKDFQTNSPLPYIIMGIMLAIVLVVSLIILVNQVLN